MTNDSAFQIDLSDLHIEDIEVLMQEGGRGMPEFAASSCTTCGGGTCSCTVNVDEIAGASAS